MIGHKLRIAFFGQKRYFESAAFTKKSESLEGIFLDLDANFSSEKLLQKVVDYKPTLIVFFRPDSHIDLNNSLFDLGIAPVVGYFSEPVGTRYSFFQDNIRERRNDLRVNIQKIKINFIICYSVELGKFVSKYKGVDFIQPLPVNDDLYSTQQYDATASRTVFLGRLNSYRSSFLNPLKSKYNPLIIENGLDFFQFSQVFSDLSFNAINIHVGTIQTFEHRVLVHMAMGHLVLSQVLQPDFGFLPNCEYVHFTNTVSLEDALSRIEKDPQWASWVAKRGRLMVEKHRASEVWERTHKSILQMNGERNGINKIRYAK